MVRHLRRQGKAMVDELAALVRSESPSKDHDALSATADVVSEIGKTHLGESPERFVVDSTPHLRWRFGAQTRVILVGHLDTVWPVGTLAEWPFQVVDARATGPGAFDMKAGLVQGFHALAALDDLDGVTVLVTGDEEIGSPSSRSLIESTSEGACAAFVLEPSASGALKTARKGVSLYELTVEGRSAHAGLEPERGVNALLELARQLLALEDVARPELGTTVTPTVASAGTVANAVPDRAKVTIDVRTATTEEQARVDRALRCLVPALAGARLSVVGAPNRPPLPASSSRDLYARAQQVAQRLGIGPLSAAEVGGGSDGNFTAAIGVPTLDGLGAVGGGAHARDEHVEIDAMPQRAALVAALIDDALER